MTPLPEGKFGAILADPPWRFAVWSGATAVQSRTSDDIHYETMTLADIKDLPVAGLAADDCVLFLWMRWSMLPQALDVIAAWSFEYKSCAFDWMKADVRQLDLFRDDATADMKMGYWSRQNTEGCLLATRGNPQRLHADVRQGIIERAREHSRKPDCVHPRIERLVGGPYLELFARQQRPGWTVWGNETDKFGAVA